MVVFFCGHANSSLSFKEKSNFSILIKKLLILYPNCNFYLGGYGNFDNFCLQYLHNLKKCKYPNIKITFVTPYLDQIYLKNKLLLNYYDDVLFPPLENVPKKFAILKRNEWAVKHSNLIIAYVSHFIGGASKTLKYAIDNGIPYINEANVKPPK